MVDYVSTLYNTSRNHYFAEKHLSYSHCLYKIQTASKTFVVSLSTSSDSLPTISIIFYLSYFYEAAKPSSDSRNSIFVKKSQTSGSRGVTKFNSVHSCNIKIMQSWVLHLV